MNDYITPKKIAEQLDISAETLKKYSLLLEQNGLDIYRNKRGHRQYSQENLKFVKALIFLNKEKSMKLEEAADLVTSADFDFNQLNVTHNGGITLQRDVITLQTKDFVTVSEQLQGLQFLLEQRNDTELEFRNLVVNKFEEQNQLILQQQQQIKELAELLDQKMKKKWWHRWVRT